MTRLFIELYLDEDVSVLVADLMRARGFIAVTTREAGRIGKGDAEQLEYAVSRRLALLTHDRADFEALAGRYFSTGRAPYGIIIAARLTTSPGVSWRFLIRWRRTKWRINCATSNRTVVPSAFRPQI